VFDEPLYGIYGIMEGMVNFKPFRFEARLIYPAKIQQFHVYGLISKFQEWYRPLKSYGLLKENLKVLPEL
jgi:hypothetical protein